MSAYQWTGSSAADLGNAANWVNISDPGSSPPQTPGTIDVAIVEVGQGLFGTLNVAALDLAQATGAPTLSITGSSTQVTAGSVGIGGGFTLDTGAYLQAGTMAIDGGGTAVTVQNNALLYDSVGENDVLTIGASTGNASLLLTKGGTMYYSSTEDVSGTLNLGGVSNSAATMTVSAGGYFGATLSSVNIGAAAGATGVLNVTGAGSQFLVDNYGATIIGDFGELGGSAQGTVAVTGGAYASLSSNDGVYIGTSAGTAEILVSGANSAVEAGPYVVVGINATNIAGDIIVQAGGEFDAATDTVLENGIIAVSGAHSLFTGRILATDGGTAVRVSTGGLVHVADAELGGSVLLTAGMLNVRESLSLYSGGEISGHGTITAATISNAGLMAATAGTLIVNGSITGTGVLQIASGAALDLGNAVAATQNIVFGANANKLLLATPSGVAGHILDFATGDAIDLLGKSATKLSYAAGALTVSNGSTLVAQLEVKGSYTIASFKLGSDGHGGSLVSYISSQTPHDILPVGVPIHLAM